MRQCQRCKHVFNAPLHGTRCPSCGKIVTFMNSLPSYAPELAHDSPGFKIGHFAELAAIEDGHFWFRARAARTKYCVA